MSVLKSIFHRYNKTTSSYDTLHPETEHAQVTDFGQGVIAHLASNVLTSTISSITSDSLMAKLVKLVFNATGVQYNIAQNGYVKFGDLFGGLIIQWGDFTNINGLSAITYPIALSNKPWAIITTEGDPAGWDNNINGIAIAGADIATASNTQANILSKWVVNGGTITRQGQNVRLFIIGI